MRITPVAGKLVKVELEHDESIIIQMDSSTKGFRLSGSYGDSGAPGPEGTFVTEVVIIETQGV